MIIKIKIKRRDRRCFRRWYTSSCCVPRPLVPGFQPAPRPVPAFRQLLLSFYNQNVNQNQNQKSLPLPLSPVGARFPSGTPPCPYLGQLLLSRQIQITGQTPSAKTAEIPYPKSADYAPRPPLQHIQSLDSPGPVKYQLGLPYHL